MHGHGVGGEVGWADVADCALGAGDGIPPAAGVAPVALVREGVDEEGEVVVG